MAATVNALLVFSLAYYQPWPRPCAQIHWPSKRVLEIGPESDLAAGALTLSRRATSWRYSEPVYHLCSPSRAFPTGYEPPTPSGRRSSGLVGHVVVGPSVRSRS